MRKMLLLMLSNFATSFRTLTFSPTCGISIAIGWIKAYLYLSNWLDYIILYKKPAVTILLLNYWKKISDEDGF